MSEQFIKRNSTILVACIVVVTVSYLVFLAASWNAFLTDREERKAKIDEMLERLPPKPAPLVKDE